MGISFNLEDRIILHRKRLVQLGVLAAAVFAFHVYLVFALMHNFGQSLGLLLCLLAAYALLLYYVARKRVIIKYTLPLVRHFSQQTESIRNYQWRGFNVLGSLLLLLILSSFLVWLIIDSANNRIRMRSPLGAVCFLLIGFFCSLSPAKIKARPVIGGLILQFSVGFLVLRWSDGIAGFGFFSRKAVEFLEFTANGTSFTYGFIADPPPICGVSPVFVFTALQIIVYFGGIVAVLYHYGIIQAVLLRVAIVMQFTLGTTAAESLNAVACIFLGQTEAAILIEPAIISMTDSEIHSMMCAGFACISGSLFAVYIGFGACPSYLLSATVMSAAVSLAVSKLIYPELEVSADSPIDPSQFKFVQRNKDATLLECLSSGAVHASHFIWAIAANLVVYVSILSLINAIFAYAGDLIALEGLSFERIVGYCFYPLAYVMGASDASDPDIAYDETMKVAQLMGIKTVLNEFIAYQKLSTMLIEGTLNGARAQLIATYALCGFSNISMIGSQIGILSVMCPERKKVFAKVAMRAFLSGVISCFLTACVAGIIIDSPVACLPKAVGQHCFTGPIPNSTASH